MAYSALPFGYVTVADDLREEVGGKISLIGIYSRELILPHGTMFPTALPKLAIVLNWFESPADHPERLDMLIYFPGDEEGRPTFTTPIPIGTAPAEIKNNPNTPDGRLVGHVRFNVVFSPAVFPSEGLLKFRIGRNGEEWRAGALRIRVADPPVQPASPTQSLTPAGVVLP